MHSGFAARVSLQLGSTCFSRMEAEDHYKEALEQEGQGNVAKAEQSYAKAIESMQAACGRYPRKYKVCQLLAEIHFKYGLLLEKQANKVAETEENYQKAEQHIATANDSKSHDDDIHRLTHEILSQYASFLRTQGKEEEAKVRLKKAVLFAPQTLLSDRIDNPAFDAHLAQFTNYSSPFFSGATLFSQTTFSSPIASKKEADGVIQAFKGTGIKGLSDVQELASLTALNDVNVYSSLITALLEGVQPNEDFPLNPFLLGGLSVVMDRRAQCAQEDFQLVGDMVKMLRALVNLLQNMQISKNHRQVEVVLQTLSLLLDQMVYFEVKDLEPETVTRLHNKLNQIKDEKQPVLSWRVRYIQQALRRIPNNANFLEAFKEKLPPAIGGLMHLTVFGLKAAAGATSSGIVGGLELGSLWEAYKCFDEAFKKDKRQKYEAWYGGLRLIDFLIETNQIEKIGELLSTANQTSKPWAKQLANEWFVWGLCDRLERLAYSSHQATRDDALRLLKGFKEGRIASVPYEGVKNYALACLNRIARIWPQPDVEQIEAAGHFPPVWHPFWREKISQTLLNQVRDKVKESECIGLIPGIRDHVAVVHDTMQQHFKSIPLSELLSQVKTALAEYYKPTLKIERISGAELDLEDCYINLAIVEGKAQREEDKDKLQTQASTFYRPSSYEEIKQTKLQKPIPLEKLFDKRKLRDDREDIPKRILIYGAAGIGKTTLCKKLVHLSQTALWQDRFGAVLWLPLRRLKTYGAFSLEKLLRKCFANTLPSGKSIATQLTEHTDKILFILDGLDEVVTELNQKTPLGEFLAYLLKRPQVIVTSRPAGVDSSQLEKFGLEFDLELKTIGFSQENVLAYLKKIEPENAANIQALIDSTPIMGGLVNIPVQLDTVCYSWKEIKAKLDEQGAKKSQTEEATVTATTLYQVMVDKLWRKDAERSDKKYNGEPVSARSLKDADLGEVEQTVMEPEADYLSYLSFKGLENNKIEFDLKYLRETRETLNKVRDGRFESPISSSVYEDIEKTSFLHTADAHFDQNKRTYYFLHLTFQEFFAAKFLAKHFQAYLTAEGEYKTPIQSIRNGLRLERQTLQDFAVQHKYNPRHQIVWRMVAGLLEGETLEGFLHLLEKESQDPDKDTTHFVLLMCALHEARARLSDATIQRLEKVLERGLLLELESEKEYEHFLLGSDLAFPEALLLKFGERNPKYRDLIYQILVRRETLSDQAVAKLKNAFQDEAYDISVVLGGGLGAYAFKVEALREVLVARFKAETEPKAILVLAVGLGVYASKNEAVREVLVARFKAETELGAIVMLAAGLVGYAGENEAVREVLVARFKAEEEPEAIAALAGGLGLYASENEAVRDMLVARFKAETEPGAIRALAGGLGLYAGENEAFRDILVARLKAEIEPDAIAELAVGLGAYASENEAVRDMLAARFKAEIVPQAIAALAAGLGLYAGESEAVRDMLAARFKAETEPDAIEALAGGLGGYASESEAVRDMLAARFKAEIEPDAIAALAMGLGAYASENEAVRDMLAARFKAEIEPDAIEALAAGLGGYASESEAVRDMLVARFKAETEPKAKAALIQELGKHMGSLDEEFQSALIAAQDSKNLEEALIT